MTEETETTHGGVAAGSGQSASAARKAPPRKRVPRGKSAASGTRRQTMAGGPKRKTVRRGRKTASRRKNALDSLVKDLAKKASQARTRLADFSEVQAIAARRAAGRVAASSKKTIERVKKEWNSMDSARKATFVAALLGALAAASGSIVARKRKR